jgi:hypothetical protein
MKTVIATLFAVMALGMLSITADAGKKCKAGFELDPDSGKCVQSDGS